MTRAEIEETALKIVNRAGDTDAEDIVSTVFELAHKEIQRYDMEWTGTKTSTIWNAVDIGQSGNEPLTTARTVLAFSDSSNGADFGDITQVKKIESFGMYSYANDILIHSYEQRSLVDVEERYMRADQTNTLNSSPLESYRGAVFASYQDAFRSEDVTPDEYIILWPSLFGSPILTSADIYFKMIYWAWLEPPSEDRRDFFTQHCADFLLYRILRDLVPAFGLSNDLETKWEKRETIAKATAIAADIGKRQSTPLKMRV